MASKRHHYGILSFGKALAISSLPAMLFALPAKSQVPQLSGAWGGGGTVLYSDGHSERAQCRAHFSQSGPNVSLEARCATPSGSVDQSARLRQVGANSFSGSFFNPQFGISGSIHITVHGNSQTVTLSEPKRVCFAETSP